MKEKFLVTSALPYANGPVHLGHIAGAYLPADIFVRFNRMLGNDVVYICGTDEYGVPITLSAQKEGITPAEVAKKYHDNIAHSFQTMNISFDNFSGTARDVHKKVTQKFFLDLLQNGYITKKSTTQFYCPNDKMFLPDRYVEGGCPKCGYENARGDECPSCGTWLDASELKTPRCAICGNSPVEKETQHWFLQLDKMQEMLEEWLETKTNWKENVKNFVRGWLKGGLKERSITRDLPWGIPVPLPDTEGKVIYVWFDAPIGYISSTIEWSEKIGKPDKWKEYWLKEDTKLVHFIGKDNIQFHTLLFPATLMGQKDKYITPWDVPANEHLNIQGQKLSTSRGNVVWVDEATALFHSDVLRYYLASNAPEKKDSDFSYKEFQQRVNKDLCDVFGNLVNRTFTFINKHFDGVIPARGKMDEAGAAFLEEMNTFPEKASELYKTFRVRDACNEITNFARSANRYFDSMEPWHLVKNDKEKCGTVLNLLANAIRILASLYYPIIPIKAQELFEMMGMQGELKDAGWIKPEISDMSGKKLNNVKTLFNKIDDKEIDKVIEDFNKRMEGISKTKMETPQEEALITIDDFKKVKLKVARVISAEKLEKSKKLLKLQIEVGEEKRQLIAGVAEHYQPEDLVGKNIIVVANLQPAKLMGELSQGMMLAAKNADDGLCFLTTEKNMKSGSDVS